MATPSNSDAMFYYFTNELDFEPEFMGRLKMAYGVASLIGIFCYNKFFKSVAFKPMLIGTSLICSVLSCS